MGSKTEPAQLAKPPEAGSVVSTRSHRSWLIIAPIIASAALLLLLLSIPLIALLRRTFTESENLNSATWETLREALRLTLVTSAISLVVIVLLGTPLAYLLARHRFRGRAIVETVIDLPMVLPPAVAGLALLMAFGRRGLVGSTLDQWGITIGFSTTAVIMAQIFVSAPFYIRAARAGFTDADPSLEEAAADLGATPLRVFASVTVPLARASLASGAVLAWARSVGEFGATIIFAGSIAGRTRTMPLAIYSRYEAGDLETALLLAVVLLGAAMFVLLAVRTIGGRPTEMMR